MENNSCPPTPSQNCHNNKPQNNVIVLCVVISLAIPIILLATYATYLHCKGKLRSRNGDGVEALEAGNGRTPRRAQESAPGLDKVTLDSYPVLVVGEGGDQELDRLEGQTCSICLHDYRPKDAVKTLPGCLHRFHAECIDRWLCSDASCPICRASPPRRSP